MIRYLLALAVAFPMAVNAQGIPSAKRQECAEKSGLVGNAAAYRDEGLSPQVAYSQIKQLKYWSPSITDAYRKKVINAVYFDERLKIIPGDVLSSQVANDCLLPPQQYQPLK